MNDLRVLRERHTSAEDALDRAVGQELYASPALVGVTTTVTTYPTSAGAYYAVNPGLITAAETEGTAGSVSADTGTVIYALNVGTSVPPNGTSIVVHGVGNRWVFRYDG